MSGPRPSRSTTVLIATPLQRRLAERIRWSDLDMELLYDPDLLPTTRYPNDHAGDPDFERTPSEQARFADWLGKAEVLLGVPGDTPGELREVVRSCPDLRWVQGTAAGAGQQVRDATWTLGHWTGSPSPAAPVVMRLSWRSGRSWGYSRSPRTCPDC